MTTINSLLLIVLFFCACSTRQDIKPNNVIGESNMQEEIKKEIKTQILEIANKEMIKEGFNLNEFIAEVYQDSSNFIVKYNLKDSSSLGGGGTIVISKDKLEIIDKKLYQ